MNYDILFVMPNTKMIDTIREVLRDDGLEYPVLFGSMDVAYQVTQNVLHKGVRVVISTGATARYLQQKLSIPTLEISYGQIEFVDAINEALAYSNRILIVSSGIAALSVMQSISLFKDRDVKIDLLQYSLERPLAEQADEAIKNGDYDVVISSTPAVEQAKRNGKIGILFGIDKRMVELSLSNAQMLVQVEKAREERERVMQAVMDFTHDGMIAVNTDGNVSLINHSAEQMLGKPADMVKGLPVSDVLRQCRIVDIMDARLQEADEKAKYVTITRKDMGEGVAYRGYLMLLRDVNEAEEISRLARKSLTRKGLVAKRTFHDISGESEAIKRTIEVAKAYAAYASTILITGESGTGKEYFAQSIHNASKRKMGPFVAVNCAALPENLLESELFGYVKGAFTGARNEGRVGMFELANNGTLFLDEVGEIPLSMQARLLRAIQEKEIMRIGDDRVLPVDVRIISASNKNLFGMIKAGKFREDLYYRLSVLELRIPPLRERIDDIEVLSYDMLRRKNKKLGRFIKRFDSDVIARMKRMEWRGNVRQLDNMIEKLIILSASDQITMETFATVIAGMELNDCRETETFTTLREHEKDYIRRALAQTGGNRTACANLLGINVTTLWRKLNQMQSE
ncbi:MAG: sigma 54-interacting transcriptional regulator [Clostridia bacterium]|nr:sigma 54-interacting transcriptional regulator [Clostridia bacterium]